MELRLMKPVDGVMEGVETEEVTRLKDKREFKSDSEWVVYQAKVFYEGFGDLESAIDILEESLRKESQNPDLMFCLAECYSRTPKRYQEALKLTKRGLGINKQSDYGYTIKARVEAALERHTDAYFSAMEALKINKYNYEAGVYLGTIGFAIAAEEGDVEEMEYSIENLKLTKRLFPESGRLTRIIEENEERLENFRMSK